MQHPISAAELTPQVAKVAGPGAPPQLKMMAATGTAPLGPVDQVTALYVLSFDGDKAVSGKAQATLGGMPDNLLHGAIDQLGSPGVLDGLSLILPGRLEVTERVLLNRATSGETVARIAAKVQDEQILEIVAANEDRMLKHPRIIEALYHNPAARMSTIDRSVELAIRNGIQLDGISCFEELKAALAGELIVEEEQPPASEGRLPVDNIDGGDDWRNLDDKLFADSLGGDGDEDDWRNLEVSTLDEALDALERGEIHESVEQAKKAQESLAMLSVSAKIRVATLGSSTQRSVLIRDANKLVVMAVVKSPGISDSEVVQFCRYRSLPEEAVRFIASKRDWTKSYAVKLNLVQNPRCPIEYSLRFLPHLRENDIRSLERDKNIPGAIVKAAKELRNKRSH